MKTLEIVVNGKILKFSTKGKTSSTEFYFDVLNQVYKAFNTNELECESDYNLYMECLRSRVKILGHFLD